MRPGYRAKIAIVAPSFGRESTESVDRFAFDYATHLALGGLTTHILTTCARSSAPDDSESYYRAGIDTTEAFPIHRFPSEAGDRAAFRKALLDAGRGGTPSADDLVDQRPHSTQLLDHLRRVAEAYDAFLFLGVAAHTTIRGVPRVNERAAIVPLLIDEPLAHLAIVTETVNRVRLLLFTSDAEATLATEWYGSAIRPFSRVIGMGVDVVPADHLEPSRTVTRRSGRPFIVHIGGAKPGHADAVAWSAVAQHERPAVLAAAKAVDLVDAADGFSADLFLAWSYGKPVIADADSRVVAQTVRETGAGWLVQGDVERDAAIREALAATPEVTARIAESGRRYVESRLGWRRAIAKTVEAIDAFGAVDDGRSREEALAQLAVLFPIVRRQRRTIMTMQISRFWKLRNSWFATKKRLGIGVADDALSNELVESDGAALAAMSDAYVLFREQQRVRRVDLDRMRAVLAIIPGKPVFDIRINLAGQSTDLLRRTLDSLERQVYGHWHATIAVDAERSNDLPAALGAGVLDERIAIGFERERDGDFICCVDAGDTFEPHALYEFAVVANADPQAVAVYADDDVIDDRGAVSNPYFKPDFSPETFLDRDYAGRAVALRRSALDAAGGLRPVFESAMVYEALLRVTDDGARVAHVPQVLFHRHAGMRAAPGDVALALEVTLKRRNEPATIEAGQSGPRVRFAVREATVAIIIPTRDRADLLGPCLTSIFERSTFSNFEVVIVDNGSREEATSQLFEQWKAREGARFSVVRDPSPFNYSRLNNAAVATLNADYVLFLNNDTCVVSPGWIEAMLRYAQRPGVGAVGALLVYPDDTVQHAGVVLGILGLAGHAHRFLPSTSPGYHGALQGVTNYAAVTGACLMIARSTFLEAGGFDEELAVAYNDVDLCLRLVAAGYRNVYVPDAKLYHFESKSRGVDNTPAKVARAMREVALLRERWPLITTRDPYYNPNLTVDDEDFSIRL